MTTVAIINNDNTPEGIIAANVPPKMTVADMMTVPMFFIVVIMPSYSKWSLYSLKRLIKNIL